MTAEEEESEFPTFFAEGPETPEAKRARRKLQAEYTVGLPEVELEDTPARFQRLFGHIINGVTSEEMEVLMAKYDAEHPPESNK
jgi:GTP cyclohydrolase I